MAVLRARAQRPVGSSRASLLPRVQQLQQSFGSQVTSALVAKEPGLLQRRPETLLANYRGLVQLLPIQESEVRELCIKCPGLLTQNPATVAQRLAKLKSLLQADDGALFALARRMPNVLKVNVDRLAGTIAFLEEAAGVDRARVLRMLMSWPMLGSVGLDTVQARHKSIAQLLGASPADTKRILASYPNLLARDHDGLADKMAHLAEVLGLDLEDVRAVMLKEPGLLNYNVRTLKSKYAYIVQVLRLPSERARTLLSHNRPLLSVPMEMPQRVEVLCRLLQLPEDDVYPLLHQHMSVIRFPPETMQAKVSVAAALCALDPGWQEQWAAGPPLLRLRVIQSGWSTIYRLVFLLHTAQSGGTSVVNVLRSVQQSFNSAYPDFLPWLARYNEAVAAQGGQAQVLPLNGGPLHRNKGPASMRCVYEPITVQALRGWHAGSLFRPGARHKAGAADAGQGSGNAAGGSNSSPPISSSDSSSTASKASRNRSSITQVADAAAAPAAAAAATGAVRSVPATRVDLLAHLLRTSAARAAELVQREPVLGRLSWVVLCARLGAIGAVLAQVGRVQGAGSGSSGGTGVSGAAVAAAAALEGGSKGARAGTGAGAAGSAAAATHAAAHGASVAGGADSSAALTEDSTMASSAAADAAASSGTQAAEDEQAPAISAQEQACEQHEEPPQPLQLQPPPWAEGALKAAAASPVAAQAIAAAVAVAGRLAPFSLPLWTPPEPQDPAVAGLVLLRPELLRSTTLQQRCAWLCDLAAASPCIADHLRALPPQRLAAALTVPRTRLAMLSYLVQTGQPHPWEVPLERLLSPQHLHYSPAAFEKAYPGFGAWKAGWPAGAGAQSQQQQGKGG